MSALWVELRTTCDRCGEGLPVNRLAPRVSCQVCGAEVVIGFGAWVELLSNPIRTRPDAPWEGAIVHRGRRYLLAVGPASAPSTWRPAEAGLADRLPGLLGTAGEDPEDVSIPLAARLPRTSALHPANRTRRWSVILDPVRDPRSVPFPWVGDADVLDDGGVVVLVRHERGTGIACFDEDVLRWMRPDLMGTPREWVVLGADGPWVVNPAWPHLLRLSPATGETIDQRGAREPDGATSAGFDLRRARDVVRCAAGGWLVVAHHQLWRFDAEHRRVRTWPASWIGRWLGGEADDPRPMYVRGEPNLPPDVADGQAEHRPTVVFDGRWVEDAHGRLYQAATDARGPFVAAFDPGGTRRWVHALPEGAALGPSRPQLGPDGSIVVAYLHPRGGGEVVRIDPEGVDRAPMPGADWRAGTWRGLPRVLVRGSAVTCWDETGRSRRTRWA